MKTSIPAVLLSSAVLVYLAPALAAPIAQADVDRAQSQMLVHQSEVVNRFAAEIKMDPTFIGYCHNEMYLRTLNHPTNGYIPFGVNYNTIRDSEELRRVLDSREGYETSFMMLCLANAKNALRQARKP